MLVTPSLDEVKLAAAKIGLPDREAQKFFHYYESNGWKVGRTKMVSFQNALAGWKLRWQDRQVPGSSFPQGNGQQITPKDRMLDHLTKEADRVMADLESFYRKHPSK